MVPEPALVRPRPEPEIMPPTVRLPAETVIVGVAPSVTLPVPRLRSFVPVKAKSPPQLWVLLFERVMAEPLVLSIVPPEIVKVPLPRAVAALMLIWPADRVVPPE